MSDRDHPFDPMPTPGQGHLCRICHYPRGEHATPAPCGGSLTTEQRTALHQIRLRLVRRQMADLIDAFEERELTAVKLLIEADECRQLGYDPEELIK